MDTITIERGSSHARYEHIRSVGRAAMLELRLMSLDSVTAYYQSLKEALIQ